MNNNIDFQNGLVVGLTVGGLTRSGLAYEPIVWTENWARDHFFIDFKRNIKPFSITQFRSSISLFNDVSGYIFIENVEKISDSVYKVYCDMSQVDIKVVVAVSDFNFLVFTSGDALYNFYVSFNVRYVPPSVLMSIFEQIDVSETFFNRFSDLVITESITNNLYSTEVATNKDVADFSNRFGGVVVTDSVEFSELNL